MSDQNIQIINSLLSGFLGALLLYIIQSSGAFISQIRFKRRTKRLVKIYLISLSSEISNYGEIAGSIRRKMDNHFISQSGTVKVSYRACEHLSSSILRQDRYRNYFENHKNEVMIIRYYRLCDLIDLMMRETPQMLSTRYAEALYLAEQDPSSFEKTTTRLLTKLDACEHNASEALEMCKKLT